mmetsp:Transcript_24679/g.52456  ORF Transcript_24679/g.52456 Transcript_24679/m.52456 type:complete len:339 (-) Transcript_24679:248-1264(-)
MACGRKPNVDIDHTYPETSGGAVVVARKTVNKSSVFIGSMTVVIGERGTMNPFSMTVTTVWSIIMTASPSFKPETAPVEPFSSSTITLEAESMTTPIPILLLCTKMSSVSYLSVKMSFAACSPDWVILLSMIRRCAASSLSGPTVLRCTSRIRRAHSQSSRTRFEGATKSTVLLEEMMDMHCSSEIESPFMTTCDASSPARKSSAPFCRMEFLKVIFVSPCSRVCVSSAAGLTSRPVTACLKTSVLIPSTVAEISVTASLASALRLCTLFLFGLHHSTSRKLSDSHTSRSCGGPSLENLRKILPALRRLAAFLRLLTIPLMIRPRCSFWMVTTAYHAL